MFNKFDNMSVKGINLWIAFELLKTDIFQLSHLLSKTLSTLKQEMHRDFTIIIQELFAKIQSQNILINELQQKNSINTLQYFDPEDTNKKLSLFNKDLIQKLELSEQKFEKAKTINESYEKQFITLCNQIKQLRNCLNELKQNQTFTEQSPSDSITEYFPEEIQFHGGKSLKKMDSSVNLERRCMSELDIIKEVTEMSAISDEDEVYSLEDKKYMLSKSVESEEKYSSFECNSSIHDVNRLLFDGYSRQTVNSSILKYEREGLSTIKDFQNKRNTVHPNLPNLMAFLPDDIKIVKKIKQNYYKCTNGYIYTGNVVKVNDADVPMGFGNLFYKNSLVYCGNWKNGSYSGYGKALFSKQHLIKQYQGELLNGTPNGCGTIRFWNGDCFMGSFSNGEAKGMGSYYHDGKIVSQGIWESGNLSI